MTRGSVSRREILVGAGTALGGLAAAPGSVSGSRGEYNVGTASPAAERAARNAADRLEGVLDWGGKKKTLTLRLPEAAVDALRNRAGVRYVETNDDMRAIAQTLPWGVDRVDAETVHADGETGGDDSDGESGADIAIIDTGIDDDHPDLQANVGSGTAYVDCSGSNCNEPWSDDNDHGTHCAGIADAADNSEGVVGVSTAATLHAVKVLDEDGSGSYSDVAAGIKYTADQGWDVGSLSLGGSKSSTVEDAVEYADAEGVLLVGAAGNDGPCTDCVSYPAAEPEVIAVSSTDSDDTLSSFSSTGSEVELAAPGGRVYSTVVGGYDTYSGTSMACPHVSGAGAQLMDNGYTNTEARDRLGSTAEDIGLSFEEQGNGLLDVEAALGSTDSAPAVSWVNPADGEMVSGTVSVQIDASDSEDGDDSLDVTYSVDGGSERATSYDSTSGDYQDSWDTTGVDDGDHTLTASATDSAGNTSTSSITVTTDNTEQAPTVDSFSASEVETGDSDAEFDVDWAVSDGDGDLSSVDLVLTDGTDGGTEDSATVSVSGDSASGTTRLVAAGDDGSGNDYTVDATVTDGAGNTASGTTSVSETERTNSAPSASIDGLSDRSNPAWGRYEVDWSASDPDGNLDTVVVELLDSGGSTLDSATVGVSGSSASGVDEVRSKQRSAEVVVTVTDTDGASGSDSRSV